MISVRMGAAFTTTCGSGVVKQATDFYPAVRSVVDGRPGDSIETIVAELSKGGALA
ncbi:MAG: hypothetical protein WKG01_00920 [Kofleriaceae bacterium]